MPPPASPKFQINADLTMSPVESYRGLFQLHTENGRLSTTHLASRHYLLLNLTYFFITIETECTSLGFTNRTTRYPMIKIKLTDYVVQQLFALLCAHYCFARGLEWQIPQIEEVTFYASVSCPQFRCQLNHFRADIECYLTQIEEDSTLTMIYQRQWMPNITYKLILKDTTTDSDVHYDARTKTISFIRRVTRSVLMGRPKIETEKVSIQMSEDQESHLLMRLISMYCTANGFNRRAEDMIHPDVTLPPY